MTTSPSMQDKMTKRDHYLFELTRLLMSLKRFIAIRLQASPCTLTKQDERSLTLIR